MSIRKNKAFTFVELIVSITIISLMSVFAIGWLMGFVEEQALTSEVTRFETMLESLDRQVKNKELYDYKLIFKKNKSYYELHKNTVWQKQKIEIGADGKITCKEIETDAICTFEDIIIFEIDSEWSYWENFEKKSISDSTKYYVENKNTREKYYFESDNYLGKNIDITVATENLPPKKETFSGNTLKFQEKLYLKIFENDKLLVAGIYKNGEIYPDDLQDSEPYDKTIKKEKNNYLIESYFQTLDKTTRLADREIRHFDEEKTITLSEILVGSDSKDTLEVTNILWKREPNTFSLIFEKLDRDFRLDFN